MNKAAIKTFAVWARNKLIDDVRYAAGLRGVSKHGIAEPLPQSTADVEFYDIGTAEPFAVSGTEIAQRRSLVQAIRARERDSDYPTAYRAVTEEVAYTWFNRLIAVRFMEVNDYLPAHVRGLSSASGKPEPDLVASPFDADLRFTSEEEARIIRLKQENGEDELFRRLFLKECNALNNILPALFERTDDYTELLLNLSFTDPGGVVYHLVHDIPEEDFDVKKGGQVEILGWLYQYYNTEPKDETFALLKKNVKVTKERIPSATQLFTPDWIVRYMTENSLGRIVVNSGQWSVDSSGQWLVVSGQSREKALAEQFGWKYYIPEAEQTEEVRSQLSTAHCPLPTDIRVIDPCCGSGHILVYAFDVLMQIYESQGWSARDAARSILRRNLYGLDIDPRAAQLAYFSVLMKARQYDRRIFSQGIQPMVFAVKPSVPLSENELATFGPCRSIAEKLIDAFADAGDLGSLITPDVTEEELAALREQIEELRSDPASLFAVSAADAVEPLAEQAQLLVQKYHAVITNPPYMGSSNMNPTLSEFVKRNYPDSKSDLFAVFIERCGQLTAENGYQAMITQHAWMFLSSFEKLREKVMRRDIVNMAHLGPRAFEEIGGEVVQTTSFVLRQSHTAEYKGTYCRLIEPTTQQGKEDLFLTGENRYTAQQSNFSKIPGSPVAYWKSNVIFNSFASGKLLNEELTFRQGMTTTNNEKYLRFWHEVPFSHIGFDISNRREAAESKYMWFPYQKGGEYRKWYGNNDYIVYYLNDGKELIDLVREKYPKISDPEFIIKNRNWYFKEGLTWSTLSSGSLGVRYCPGGFIFDAKGSMAFPVSNTSVFYYIALLNSCVTSDYLDVLAPTLDFNIVSLKAIPYICSEYEKVSEIAQDCVDIVRADWDCFERSWNFVRHPLVRPVATVAEAYAAWETECAERFTRLKANEEELNRIFIDIYGLQDELTPEVEEKDVTVRKADLTRDIKSLISYAVGCMFGRYDLDKDGIMYAGGEWNPYRYSRFIPDQNGIIPITDEEYLEDDIVGYFCKWLTAVYGKETLEENLNFVADALGGKGGSSREVIRNYFLRDFFKDHCKIYQKRPIYWLFDSGKQNSFKALVYLHRLTPDTVGELRVGYLHRMQRVYESEIARMQDMADHSQSPREAARAVKRREKLLRQQKECREYDEKIGHLAISRTALDLDDGVKVNYEKLQTAKDGVLYPVLAKIG